jgi:hypothetical protein
MEPPVASQPPTQHIAPPATQPAARGTPQRTAPRAAPGHTIVERRIAFFRVYAGCDDAGRPLPFDPGPALARVHRLPFTAKGRYWQDDDGNATCCWVDCAEPMARLRFGHIRRSGLPQVERRGLLTPLHIPAASGLVEQVHVVFFPGGIIGSEFNFYGPRVPRLAQYLAAKAGEGCAALAFEPLLRQDVAAQLDQLADIRLVRLRIRASYAAQVAQADRDLGSAFAAAGRAGDAEELEIVLKSLPRSRHPLAERLLGAVKRLAGFSDLRSEVSRFDVKGLHQQTGHVEELDILSDQLIATGQIIRQDARTRALDPDSAYAAIERAEHDLHDQLELAAGVTR